MKPTWPGRLLTPVKPYLNAVERNDICVAIGAGETFVAIRELVKCVAIRRIPVGPDLLQRSVYWLGVYARHEDERYLRRLIEDFVFPNAIRTSATLRVDRLSTSPQQPRQPAALTRGPTPSRASEILGQSSEMLGQA